MITVAEKVIPVTEKVIPVAEKAIPAAAEVILGEKVRQGACSAAFL